MGAAAYVSHGGGVPVEKMEHVYLGPSYTNEDVIAACARHPSRPQWQKETSSQVNPQRQIKPCRTRATLLLFARPAGGHAHMQVVHGVYQGLQAGV